MSSRRILLLITDLEIGGTPTVVRELALRLNRPPTVTIDVACLGRWGPVAGELAVRGIRVRALNASGPTDFGVIRRLIKLVRGDDESASGYDTVFSFLVHANVAASIASRFCQGVRWIQSIQTTQSRPRWHWWAQSAAQFAAERIVVPSDSVAQAARDVASVPADKVVVIPNAIDADAFQLLRGPEHPGTPSFVTDGCDGSLLPPGGAVQRVGFIGRLDPIKRIGDLIAAIKLLPAPIELHIFGEGAERHKLQRLIAHLKLSARVRMRGAVSDPREALGQIDLLVLCSEAEGFGLVLIEAMAAGVPVVGTNVPGIRDVIRDNITGVLVPPASPPALASAIVSLLGDSWRRDQLREHGRADVIKRFSWEGVLPMYRRLLGIEGEERKGL